MLTNNNLLLKCKNNKKKKITCDGIITYINKLNKKNIVHIKSLSDFLSSEKAINKKFELDSANIKTHYTIRIFDNSKYKRKYIRRYLVGDINNKDNNNSSINETNLLFNLLNMANSNSTKKNSKKKKKSENSSKKNNNMTNDNGKFTLIDPFTLFNMMDNSDKSDNILLEDATILFTNYITDKRDNNYIEENVLYTNFNLENFTGEDMNTIKDVEKSYNNDIKDTLENNYDMHKVNDKYFEIEFKLLNMLGTVNGNIKFGDYLQNLWIQNDQRILHYINYLLKLIECINCFERDEVEIKDIYDILNEPLAKELDIFEDIKLILGNFSIKLKDTKNLYSINKFSIFITILCSFLVMLNRFEHDNKSKIKSDYVHFEEKIYNNVNKKVKRIGKIKNKLKENNNKKLKKFKSKILKSNILDGIKMYVLISHLKLLINVKYYNKKKELYVNEFLKFNSDLKNIFQILSLNFKEDEYSYLCIHELVSYYKLKYCIKKFLIKGLIIE